MSEQTFRERWTAEVFRTPLASDAVRVALLALAQDMDDAGMVETARDDLAEMLGRSDRRIGERIKAAIDAGLLQRVSRGQRNGRSRYRATLPGAPSSGRPGVPKKPTVFRTPGGPEEDSLQDGLQVQENPSLEDTRGSSREPFDPSVFRTPGGPEEAAPLIRNRARALVTGDRPEEPTPSSPATTGTDETTPDETNTRVSQSSRKREAFRWLNDRYGLTEFEAASVVAEVNTRAPKEIRALVPYLAGMKEGDLADIAAAVLDRTPEKPQVVAPAEPARPLTSVPQWCGHCDERTRLTDRDDGRVSRCPACHPLRNGETA